MAFVRKFFLGVVSVGVVSLLAGSLVFYLRHLRGVWTAILPAPTVRNQVIEPPASRNSTGLPLTLPDGFSISLFASNVPGARVLREDPQGVLLVSLTSSGRVVALPDRNDDGVADAVITVAEQLIRPHGLVFDPEVRDRLYIAETHQVVAYAYDRERMTAAKEGKVFDLPGGGNHFTRTIGFGPDGHFYISVGSTCNVCRESDVRRAAIVSADGVGQTLRPYASGLRNAVFFVWHPVTQALWATEMGRDLLGDTLPPDEINIITEGKYYGWPFCYGKRVHDKRFDLSRKTENVCEESEPSLIDLPAHSAPLGLAFVPESPSWPEEYWNNLLVAYHGSWNRSVPDGYKVVRIRLDQRGNYVGTGDFLTGWLSGRESLGRPVDILLRRDGIGYISDDKRGAVYRITVLHQ